MSLTGTTGRLQQVLWNLIHNAIKFTPAGGRVEIAVRQPTERLEIVVHDSGCGIGAEFLPHVFDRFRQEDASLGGRTSGLGLGLSITKHLVELHGGTIEARSGGAGSGATFIVHIPKVPRAHVGTTPRQSEPPHTPLSASA